MGRGNDADGVRLALGVLNFKHKVRSLGWQTLWQHASTAAVTVVSPLVTFLGIDSPATRLRNFVPSDNGPSVFVLNVEGRRDLLDVAALLHERVVDELLLLPDVDARVAAHGCLLLTRFH